MSTPMIHLPLSYINIYKIDISSFLSTLLFFVVFRSLAKTGEPSNDLYSPTAQAHIFSSPTLLPLTKKQRRLVTKNPGTILAIAKGARMAVDECQNQFEDRRWNCSIQENGHGGSIFGKIIERGNIPLTNLLL
jgi:hypothetical protein